MYLFSLVVYDAKFNFFSPRNLLCKQTINIIQKFKIDIDDINIFIFSFLKLMDFVTFLTIRITTAITIIAFTFIVAINVTLPARELRIRDSSRIRNSWKYFWNILYHRKWQIVDQVRKNMDLDFRVKLNTGKTGPSLAFWNWKIQQVLE